MRRTLFKSKIHRATVTHADLDYEGSVTIDGELMRAADILPYESVNIWNVTNGAASRPTRSRGRRGPASSASTARPPTTQSPADVVIIATFADAVDEDEARAWKPTVVRVDAQNRIVADRAARSCRDRNVGCARSRHSRPVSRIDALLGFIQQKPQDPFPRYALALEYKNGGRLDEARATFDALHARHPDYIAAYLHAGNTLWRSAIARRRARGVLPARRRGVRAPGRHPRARRARGGAGDRQ